MDIETALAELGHYITHHLDVSYQNAWDEVLAERQQLQQQLQDKEEEEARLREAMAEYLSAYDGIMRGGLAATERLSIALSTLRQALEESDAD